MSDDERTSDRQLVERLQQCLRLTEWEVGFADSILRWVNRGSRLSAKQRATAEEILEHREGL